MKRNKIGVIIAFFLVGVISGCSALPSSDTKMVCYKRACVEVEVAGTPEEHARGLQNRKSLGQNNGMLFLFDEEKEHSFWMKDTLIPLDIIWINHEREVVNMALFVPPCTNDLCPDYAPNEKAKYVLEMNAGKSEQMGFAPGDRLTFK